MLSNTNKLFISVGEQAVKLRSPLCYRGKNREQNVGKNCCGKLFCGCYNA